MTDERTMAYLNLFAVLGTLPRLCELDESAKAIINGKNVSIGISVKDGPEGTLRFQNGSVTIEEGTSDCAIKLPFSKCSKFNGMIDGTVTPIPSKGFTKIGFLLKSFIPLTDKLSAYLRPAEGALEDEKFFQTSTKLMLELIARAVVQIGNEDKVGRASASYIDDGVIKIAIGDELAVAIEAKNSKLRLLSEVPAKITSYMRFSDLRLARKLFDGEVNSVACVGEGKIRIGGIISQVDNVNRILDRVALYLG